MIVKRIVQVKQGGRNSQYEIFSIYDSVIISRYLSEDATDITIPDTIEGLPVVQISNDCFMGHEEIQHITFPQTLRNIGANAFMGCRGLEEIILPESVLKIGDGAFWGCRGLKKIKLPTGLRTINYQTFAYCDVRQVEITLPEQLRIIEPRAFYRFCNTKSPSYERWLERLKGRDFDSEDGYSFGPSGLERDLEVVNDMELVLPESVIDIGDSAFFLGPRVKTKLPQEERWYSL